jgi:cation diffusion facilitator CzcD-associated flavoprotein CzcO
MHLLYHQGAELFAGRQMHARDLKDASIANGQRVVVIGAGKTALDCAAEVVVSSRAASVTWLFRQVGARKGPWG